MSANSLRSAALTIGIAVKSPRGIAFRAAGGNSCHRMHTVGIGPAHDLTEGAGGRARACALRGAGGFRSSPPRNERRDAS